MIKTSGLLAPAVRATIEMPQNLNGKVCKRDDLQEEAVVCFYRFFGRMLTNK